MKVSHWRWQDARISATKCAVAVLALLILFVFQESRASISNGSGGGGSTISRGVFASAPACAALQFIYNATDAALQGFCNGASVLDWKYKGVTVTPTVIGDLTFWFNQGTATTVTLPGSWILRGTTGAGDNWRGRVKSVPATPFSVVACMEGLAAEAVAGGFGMLWTDGTQLIPVAYNIQITNGAATLGVFKYSNATTFSNFYVSPALGVTGTGMFCLAMVDDGTNRKEKYSVDGLNWTQLHTALRTDFLTATAVGVVVNDAATSVPPQVQVVSVVTLASAL